MSQSQRPEIQLPPPPDVGQARAAQGGDNADQTRQLIEAMRELTVTLKEIAPDLKIVADNLASGQGVEVALG